MALQDNRFDPATLAMPANTKVTFANKGTLSHTVTIAKQGDEAGQYLADSRLQPGAVYRQNFPDAGTYQVWCRDHGAQGASSGMTMTITVK